MRLILILMLGLWLPFVASCGTTNPQLKKPENAIPPAGYPLHLQNNLFGQFQESLEQFDGKVGLYTKNLKNGFTYGFNQDTIFPTASTHKILVALAVYKYLYLDATLAEKKQYDENIKKMMVISDNPSFFQLLDDIERKKPDAITRVLTDLKLTHTRIHSREAFYNYNYHSVTTPYEMAVVFEAIYNETYLNKEFSAILKEELSNTVFKEEIPRFMPNAKVMHKVGELPGVQCDVGVVDDGNDLILISIYTTTRREAPYASNFIANTSAGIYNLLRTQK